MDPITLTLPYDQAIALSLHRFRIRRLLRKHLIVACINVLLGGFVAGFAFYRYQKLDPPGDFFLAMAVYVLFSGGGLVRFYFRNIRSWRKVHDAASAVRVQAKDVAIWEFTDQGLRVKDLYYDQTFRWEAFRGYQRVKGKLLLLLKESVNQYHILSETEMSPLQYADVIAFVRKKMPPVAK